MQVTLGHRCRGADAGLRSPCRLPRAANWPEVGRKRGFSSVGEGMLCCFYGDFGGIFAVNTARGRRLGGSKQVSTAQRLACDQLSCKYCRRFRG